MSTTIDPALVAAANAEIQARRDRETHDPEKWERQRLAESARLRLNAAAPALLAVLDSLIAYHCDDGTHLDEIVREARAAVAQARGETT